MAKKVPPITRWTFWPRKTQELCFANRLAGSLPSNFLKIFKNFSEWSRNTDEYRMPPRYLSLPSQDAHSAPRPSFPCQLCYNSDSQPAAWVPQRSFSDLWRTTKSWYYVGSRRDGEVMTRRWIRFIYAVAMTKSIPCRRTRWYRSVRMSCPINFC